MATTTNAMAPAPRVIPLRTVKRSVDRADALRRVRAVRRHVQSREERFAHLKRSYD